MFSILFRCIAPAILCGSTCLAANPTYKLEFGPHSSLRELLTFYSKLTKRKVWLDLSVHANPVIRTEAAVSYTDAVELIRSTLLERYGIELREPNAAETFVSWSTDPKYERLRSAPNVDASRSAEPSGNPRPRIRVIEETKAK